jgi:hypothetical protein
MIPTKNKKCIQSVTLLTIKCHPSPRGPISLTLTKKCNTKLKYPWQVGIHAAVPSLINLVSVHEHVGLSKAGIFEHSRIDRPRNDIEETGGRVCTQASGSWRNEVVPNKGVV